MSVSTPRVSVLMPVWRPDPEYLRASIQSVRDQTLGEWELILVEDSPLSAAPIVASFRDPRIVHIERTQKASLAGALNDGLRACHAGLVARLDGDDLCLPERLSQQVAYLESHPSIAAVGSSLTIIDAWGNRIGHRAMPSTPEQVGNAMRRYNAIAHPSVMFRKEAVVQAGAYRNVPAEDYDLWCRLILDNHQLTNLPAELLRYRFHEGALKFEAVHQAIRDAMDTKRRYFRERWTLRDRARIAGERLLLLLPPPLVLRLFRRLVYRS